MLTYLRQYYEQAEVSKAGVITATFPSADAAINAWMRHHVCGELRVTWPDGRVLTRTPNVYIARFQSSVEPPSLDTEALSNGKPAVLWCGSSESSIRSLSPNWMMSSDPWMAVNDALLRRYIIDVHKNGPVYLFAVALKTKKPLVITGPRTVGSVSFGTSHCDAERARQVEKSEGYDAVSWPYTRDGGFSYHDMWHTSKVTNVVPLARFRVDHFHQDASRKSHPL